MDWNLMHTWSCGGELDLRKENDVLHTTAGIYGLILEEIGSSRLIILRRDSDHLPTL